MSDVTPTGLRTDHINAIGILCSRLFAGTGVLRRVPAVIPLFKGKGGRMLLIECGFEDGVNRSPGERKEVDGGEPVGSSVGQPIGEVDIEVFAVGSGERALSPLFIDYGITIEFEHNPRTRQSDSLSRFELRSQPAQFLCHDCRIVYCARDDVFAFLTVSNVQEQKAPLDHLG
jgi:hypothetical protein